MNLNLCFLLEFFLSNELHVEIAGTLVPQRVVMGIMGTLAIAVSYTIRACISVAITEMVVPVNHTNKDIRMNVCNIICHFPKEHMRKNVLKIFHCTFCKSNQIKSNEIGSTSI